MNQIQFMHYRSPTRDTTHGATVAILPQGDLALIAVSFCGPKDAFNRKIGRAVAAGRIMAALDHRADRPKMAGMVRQVPIADPTRLKECVADALDDEMNSEGLFC